MASDFSDHMENAFARSNILVRATGSIESNIDFQLRFIDSKSIVNAITLDFGRHNHQQSKLLSQLQREKTQ
jgi:hypothetical protein